MSSPINPLPINKNAMMNPLTHEDLMSLEAYAEARPEFRTEVISHKKNRTVPIGPNATLYFEDRLTIQYQIQEMLRVERIFERDGITEELEAYNPLIPDGRNWKATFMVEYENPEERARMLAELIGIDRALWVQVEGFEKVHPITNEDMERETEEKTSAVHFMRFELTDDMAQAAKSGAAISAGCDLPAYKHSLSPIPENTRVSLAADLD